MADKVVIVQIDYDVIASIKNLQNLTAAVEGERVAQARLKSELESGKISQTEYSKAVEESKQKMTVSNTERKSAIQLIASEKGSVNELKTAIKTMTIERDKLNRTTVQGKKDFQEYNKKIVDMKDALKGAQKDTGKAGGAFMQLGNNLKSIGGPIGGVIQGIMGITKAGLAFIATPIGLVLAAIAVALKTLMAYFKGSEEGQNRLNKIMAAFHVIAGNVGDLIQKVGKWIYEAFSKPKELLIDLGNLIKDQIINRFTAFGVIGKAIIKIFSKDWKEGFKELAEGGIQATTGITDAFGKMGKAIDFVKEQITETSAELEKMNDLSNKKAALDKKIRNEIIQDAKEEMMVAELRAKAAQKDKYTGEERLKMIDEAAELEKRMAADDINIAKQKASIHRQEMAMHNATKETLDEQAKLDAEVFNVQKRNADTLRGLERQRQSAITQIKKEEEEAIALLKDRGKAAGEAMAAFKKQQEEEAIIRGKAINRLAGWKAKEMEIEAKSYADKRDAQIASADLELETALEKKGLLYEEIELLEYEHKIRLQEIETAYQENIAQQRATAWQGAYDDMQSIIESTQGMADARVTIMSDAFAKLSTIDWKGVKSAKDAFAAIGFAAQGLTNLIIQGHEAELNDLNASKAAELALAGNNEAQKEAIESKYNKKLVELKKKQFHDDKKKALIDASIATALAVIKGLASGLPMPGILMAALAAVLGGIQIASIARQPEPKFTSDQVFAKGGIIGGKSHAQGGTKFTGDDGSRFVAEKGESMFVLKKDATAEIAALSMINESFGGRSMTRKSTHLAEGGEVDVNIEKTIDEAIQRTPIFVKVGDIETGMTNYNKTKEAGVI